MAALFQTHLSPFLTTFLKHGAETVIAAPLQEVTQHHLVGGFAVEEGAHRDGVAKNAGGLQHLAGGKEAHRAVGTVDLHSLRPPEPHHPDKAGARLQQFGDLEAQVGLILALTGIFHRQGRGGGEPTGGVGAGIRRGGDGDIGSAQGAGLGAEAGVDPGPGDVGIRVDNRGAGDVGSGMLSPRRGAVDGMAVGELVAVPVAQLIGTEGTGLGAQAGMAHMALRDIFGLTVMR